MGSQSQDQEEYHDIVIVGAGICGLATALALHRKGIKSLVLEKHCELRDTGAAISIYLNGWRALDQLGIGVELRMKSIPITELHDVWISKDGMQITPIGKEGLQCVKRRDLVETLAESLPSKSIRFGCRIVALETDPESSFPVIRIEDGSILKTKEQNSGQYQFQALLVVEEEEDKRKKMRREEESHDIVIVGGGICGLATALALHRKGIKSLVLERSDTLRATGATISVYLNGWHALDQLGVGSELRAKSIPITEVHDELVYKDGIEITPISKEGLQCVKRSDLIETMAAHLPTKSIRFGCQIVAVETDPITSFPIVCLEDGSMIRMKVLIGCEGSNSVVAKTIGLKAPKLFQTREVRGFTSYPNGHDFSNHFLRLRGDKFFLGRVPVDDKLVFWFVDQEFHPEDLETRKDPKLMRDRTLKTLHNCSTSIIEMVKNCDLNSLSLTRIRYRAPWHLAFTNLFKGTITVAGDAMHQMDPSIGQGGCAALEDAVVLARCLAQEIPTFEVGDKNLKKRVVGALRKYVRERRWRILILSTKSYLIGSLFAASWIRRMMFLTIFTTFFGGRFGHTQYNCGHL